MIMFKDELAASSGSGKFVHVLTWPIRKFYITIPILALIYATPIFFGVKPLEVHIWYKEKAIELYEKATGSEFYTSNMSKAKTLLGMKADDGLEKSRKKPAVGAPEGRGIDTLVDMPRRKTSATSRSEGFEVSDNIPRVEIEVDYDARFEEPMEYDKVMEEAVVLPQTVERKTEGFIIRKDNPNLVYLENPKDVVGKAVIKNANELEVDDVYIVLYGIYANPNNYQGVNAKAFLEAKVRDKMVKCRVVAYTYQNIATAVCFVGTENLNQTMVDKGYSKNVALSNSGL